MDKSNSQYDAPDRNAGVLKTKFVTPDQTTALTQILDLAFEELDQVGVGVTTCQCVNCCSGQHVIFDKGSTIVGRTG